MNQHDTYIKAEDHSSKIYRDAIPNPAQPTVVIPNPNDSASVPLSERKRKAELKGKFYGVNVAWRGLYLLGSSLIIGAIWFIYAWIKNGRIPLSKVQSNHSFGIDLPSILPPDWLLSILGLMVILSFGMMIMGAQDITGKMKQRK